MFALRNPVQPGGGKGLPSPKDTTFLWPGQPTSSCQRQLYVFELPLSIEQALLEKKLGNVTRQEDTIIVSNNRLMRAGRTKKWMGPGHGAVQGGPPALLTSGLC